MRRLMTTLVLIVFVSFFQTSCGDKSSKPISGDSLKSISVNKKDYYVSSSTIIIGKLENVTLDSLIKLGEIDGKLEIAQLDFNRKMNWDDATKACSDLGDGWRLPTIKELLNISDCRDLIGAMPGEYYWSSTPTTYNGSTALHHGIKSNYPDLYTTYRNTAYLYVRAVRQE